MALRIPIGADQTLQVEFHEVERRLRRLEKRTGMTSGTTTLQVIGGGGSTVDLKPINDRLDALELAVAAIPDPIVNDFGAEGPAAVRGLVPTPGSFVPPTGMGDHVLKADATWGYPFRGLVSVATPGDETFASDTLDVKANLIATGKVVSAALETGGEVRANGIVYGELEQANLRGLMQVLTALDQVELPTDIVNLLGSLAITGCLSAETITCGDIHINGTLDGGTP